MEIPETMLPHIAKIFSGEYEIGYQSATPPVILDIGANIGGFAAWAKLRWPGCQLHCFEPISENFRLLKNNVADYAAVHNVALGSDGACYMYYGKNNCGEASMWKGSEQSGDGETVAVAHPDAFEELFKRANIIKIDTEGAEVEILSRVRHWHADVLLMEYHSEANRRAVEELLPQEYRLVQCAMTSLDRGIAKYAKLAK